MQGVVSAEQILFGKATLYSTVFHHHKVRAAECLFKAITERMFETSTGIDGGPFEDPSDMLRLVDADFTKWVTREPDPDVVTDDRTRHLLGLLGRRELPVRIYKISARTIEGSSLQELFRYRDPSPDTTGSAYAGLLEIRKAIAGRVRDTTGDPTVYEDEVWIDLPRRPDLGYGTLIDRDDQLVELSDVFPTHQWVEYYKQHRYVGYVLGPRRHKDAVADATRSVLSQQGIRFLDDSITGGPI